MLQYFAFELLLLTFVQIQTRQGGRNNKSVPCRNAEIGDVNQTAALTTVAPLQTGGLPVFDTVLYIAGV